MFSPKTISNPRYMELNINKPCLRFGTQAETPWGHEYSAARETLPQTGSDCLSRGQIAENNTFASVR